MEFPYTINNQEELDNLFKDRVARVTKKYEGYDTYKAKAEELDKLKADDLPGQLAKANQSLKELQDKMTKSAEEYKTKSESDAKSIADLTSKLTAAEGLNTRTQITIKYGLPIEFAPKLDGENEEEWAKSAEAWAPRFATNQPVQPMGGNDPTGKGSETTRHPFSGEMTESQMYNVYAQLAQNLTGE